MSNWRFYGGDLSVVINPPIDTFWVGVPETVAYIGLWCTKDSTGTVTPIGSGFDTTSFKSAKNVILPVSSANIVTFQDPYPGGTVYSLLVRCYDATGNNVDYQIDQSFISETGFNITVPVACYMDFQAKIVNDIPVVT